jgi:hypothetical protein
MTALEPWASQAGQIGKDRKPPDEAVRGPSSSSTALDPEPTAQTDPKLSFMTSSVDGGVGWEADILTGLPHVLSGCSTAGGLVVKNSRIPHNRKEI